MIKTDPVALDWLLGHPTAAVVKSEMVGCFDIPSDYFDTYWLPVLGPTATLALTKLAIQLNASGESGFWLPVEPFGQSLGVRGMGRNSGIVRALHRLVCFKLAAIDYDHDLLQIATRVGYISARGYHGLPAYLQVQHQQLTTKERS